MFLICVFGGIFLLCFLRVWKEENGHRDERYERKDKGGWSAKPQNPALRMKQAFVCEPTEREKFEYGMTHMGYYPPYCNRNHEHCRQCGLCRSDGMRDCRGYSVINGLGAFPPSECLNCSYRCNHGGGDPFWDCTHPQARHVMRDAEMGLGICRPMFGPNAGCPFKSCEPGSFSEDWDKAKDALFAWNDLVRKYIDDVKEITKDGIVWKDSTPAPKPSVDPIAQRRYDAQRAAVANGVKPMV